MEASACNRFDDLQALEATPMIGAFACTDVIEEEEKKRRRESVVLLICLRPERVH